MNGSAVRESLGEARVELPRFAIPHHQGAIEMAKVAYEKSDNPQIKELAQNIMSAQQEEIEQMNRWRHQWYPEG